MNTKLLISGLFACFPALALAAGGLSGLNFAPPVGDYSVVFLGNIFGIVDGVLHGTGSQIMGNMFGVFNAAVLALGGIVIMYTLLVATLNTAHEGEVLGSQWSSIWIPMRSTLGLALLIPKASGYCMMQIFIMWVIVQGVGAADKVWNAALSYLNRGGVIVQAQQPPINSLNGNAQVGTAAALILSGQVCMGGVQMALESQRQAYLALKSTGAGPCASPPAGSSMAAFCNNPVPDFLGSVNTVAVQQASQTPNSTDGSHYVASMPNFAYESTSPYLIYNALNGLCGSIEWSPVVLPSLYAGTSGILNASERNTAQMSRAIALQQMYMDLTTVAQIIVNNNPTLNPSSSTLPPFGTLAMAKPPGPAFAQQQLGVPYLNSGGPCGGMNTITNCVSWGSASTSLENGSAAAGAPLFSGTEFQGAMEDYSGVMLPTLSLISHAQYDTQEAAGRAFIATAESQGWMMAGSYFFNLVSLNGLNTSPPDTVDTDPGLSLGSWGDLVTSSGSACSQTSTSSPAAVQALVALLSSSGTASGQATCSNLLSSIITMINGNDLSTPPLQGKDLIPPNSSYGSSSHNLINGPLSATAYGYINNAIMVQLPGQPGLTPPSFSMNFNIKYSTNNMRLPTINFGCGNVKTFVFTFCLGGLLGDIFYNLIMVNVFNYFILYVVQFINQMMMQFMVLPLMVVAGIFINAVKSIEFPMANPIVSLANMGVTYINQASTMWLAELILAIGALMIPWFGLFMLAMIAMALPLLAAWLSVMVSIGFVTAYYVPILPYMIFTFGSLAWLMATIEAMVAAPLVALGVSNPEGHQAFGKAEQSLMILLNVFLRPALMIIGYIAAIALSYVSIWVLNAGFATAISYINPVSSSSTTSTQGPILYTNWASLYSLFFSVLIYTTMYLTLVQKSFGLISELPDKVLRWIGGAPESRGAESAEWAGEVKGQVEKGGEASAKGQGSVQAEMKASTTDKLTGGKGGGGMGAEG